MSQEWVSGVQMVTEECCNCGMTFGMTKDFQRRALNDRSIWFYCPRGHQQHYTGKTEAQKLRDQLERERQRTEQEQLRAQELEQEKHRVKAQYNRIRKRVKNGVCPCCNRTFENLANHMKHQHPAFGDEKQLKTLRLAYGLTQYALAEECGVDTHHISLFENERDLPDWARIGIENWMNTQAG